MVEITSASSDYAAFEWLVAGSWVSLIFDFVKGKSEPCKHDRTDNADQMKPTADGAPVLPFSP